jgi:hypothetical protein
MKLISILREQLLKEYSEKIIKQLTDKWKKENRNINDTDIKNNIDKFDKIKQNIPAKLKAGQITLSKKFTEKDPKTNKGPLNPSDILNYTWKDLEGLIDSYGEKAVKVDKDFKTVQDAELIKIDGVPIVYNAPDLKVYEGSDFGSCVKLNYAFKYKGEDKKIYTYNFCIGRKEDSANRYYPYRFGSGGKGAMYRSFYFVADPTQSAEIKGEAFNRENFVNYYHFFIIHCFENGKFGVTDAVNEYEVNSTHELDGKGYGVDWEEIGKFMIKNGGESGKKAWDKIKGRKDIFKYVSPSQEETDLALVRDQILNDDAFQKLTRSQKAIYISKRADQPGAFTPEMFKSLDNELKNLALRTGTGYKASYDDLKGSNALLRSYAKFRFSRGITDYRETGRFSTILPLPFVQYLDDKDKKEYLKLFDKNYLSFELTEKYFGEDAAKEHVKEQVKTLDYLPESAIKYISDPKLKQLYSAYAKLTKNWEPNDAETFNADNEKFMSLSKMPEQDLNPVLIDYKQWLTIPSSDRKTLINLANKVNGNEKYGTLIYALPITIKSGGKDYALLPTTSKRSDYTDWVLVDEEGKVIKSKIDGNTFTLDGVPIATGYPNINNYKRVYNAKDAELNGEPFSLKEITMRLSDVLQEIKINQPNPIQDKIKQATNTELTNIDFDDKNVGYFLNTNNTYRIDFDLIGNLWNDIFKKIYGHEPDDMNDKDNDLFEEVQNIVIETIEKYLSQYFHSPVNVEYEY